MPGFSEILHTFLLRKVFVGQFSGGRGSFSMTESQYISLVEDDKRKVMDEILTQMTRYRGLARELLGLARKARASGRLAQAESYYATTLGLGRLLSRNGDGTIIVRLVGIAYQTAGLEGLSDVYKGTGQSDKLNAVLKQLEQVEDLRNRIKKKASQAP